MSCFTPRGEGRIITPREAVFGLFTVQLWTDSHDGAVQIGAIVRRPGDELYTSDTLAKRALLTYLREIERDVRQAITTLEAEVQP